MERIAKGKETILLKPNLVRPSASDDQAGGDPTLAQLMQRAGKEVSIGKDRRRRRSST